MLTPTVIEIRPLSAHQRDLVKGRPEPRRAAGELQETRPGSVVAATPVQRRRP
jgi:hypothetical protein